MGNSNFTVSGEVRLDTAQAEAGAQRVKTEIENLGAAAPAAQKVQTGLDQMGGSASGAAQNLKATGQSADELKLRLQVLQTQLAAVNASLPNAVGDAVPRLTQIQAILAQKIDESKAQLQGLGGAGEEATSKLAGGIRGVFPALTDLRQITRLAMGAFAIGFLITEFGNLVKSIQAAADALGGFDAGMKLIIADAEKANETILRSAGGLTKQIFDATKNITDEKERQRQITALEVADLEKAKTTANEQVTRLQEELDLTQRLNRAKTEGFSPAAGGATGAAAAAAVADAENQRILDKAKQDGIELTRSTEEIEKDLNEKRKTQSEVIQKLLENENRGIAERNQNLKATGKEAESAAQKEATALKELDALAQHATLATDQAQGAPEIVALQKQQDEMLKIDALEAKFPALHDAAVKARTAVDQQYYSELDKLQRASDQTTQEFLEAEVVKRQELNGKGELTIQDQGEATKQKLIDQAQVYFQTWDDLQKRATAGDAAAWAEMEKLGSVYFDVISNLYAKLASVDETTNARILRAHTDLVNKMAEDSTSVANGTANQLDEIAKRANDQQLSAERQVQEDRKGISFNTSSAIEKIRLDEAAQILKINQDAEAALKKIQEDELQSDLDQLATGLAANVDYNSKLAQVQQSAANARVAIEAAAQAEIVAQQNRAVDQMAGKMEGFINSTILSARSFGDFLNNLWKEILGEFVHMVTRMIAEWALGVNQMHSSSSATSLGGGLLGIIGKIFGGGTSSTSAASTAIASTSGAISTANQSAGITDAFGSTLFGPGGGGVAGSLDSGAIADFGALSAASGSAGLSSVLPLANASGGNVGAAVASLIGGSGTPSGLAALSGGGGGSIADLSTLGGLTQQGAFPDASGISGPAGVLTPNSGVHGGATAGALGQAAFGNFAGLASLVPQLAVAGGLSLLGGAAGSQNPLTGGLMGAAGGGLAAAGGLALAASISPALLGSQIGFLFGPIGIAIGAGIGALIGVISGILNRGKAKKEAAALEQQYEFAADTILAEYKNFQTDYQTALTGMQQLESDGTKQLLNSGLGSAGRKGAENMKTTIDAEIADLNEWEKERQARLGVINAMPLPEFEVGGMVSGFGVGGLGTGGAVPIIAHAGEFVMRREAVESLGSDFLHALNHAPSFSSGGEISSEPWLAGIGSPSEDRQARKVGDVTVEIHHHGTLIDAKAVEKFYRDTQPQLVASIRRARWDGA